jgi:hypothetical protein
VSDWLETIADVEATAEEADRLAANVLDWLVERKIVVSKRPNWVIKASRWTVRCPSIQPSTDSNRPATIMNAATSRASRLPVVPSCFTTMDDSSRAQLCNVCTRLHPTAHERLAAPRLHEPDAHRPGVIQGHRDERGSDPSTVSARLPCAAPTAAVTRSTIWAMMSSKTATSSSSILVKLS